MMRFKNGQSEHRYVDLDMIINKKKTTDRDFPIGGLFMNRLFYKQCDYTDDHEDNTR